MPGERSRKKGFRKKRARAKKVEVNVNAPIHSFGFFTFKEIGVPKKDIQKASNIPIYVFPKSTAAIAEA